MYSTQNIDYETSGALRRRKLAEGPVLPTIDPATVNTAVLHYLQTVYSRRSDETLNR